ncbi:hypothetical protein GGX14DRAFT_407934 [Mycena pura]|uniref:Uncharacterized protein n=1 Tax=Mycena pura TaxID=153505 RepID=A0AAD6UMI8_9AGAR|nr:hypothetical protein GGX14DRAFT_407934 [Mycena pura]
MATQWNRAKDQCWTYIRPVNETPFLGPVQQQGPPTAVAASAKVVTAVFVEAPASAATTVDVVAVLIADVRCGGGGWGFPPQTPTLPGAAARRGGSLRKTESSGVSIVTNPNSRDSRVCEPYAYITVFLTLWKKQGRRLSALEGVQEVKPSGVISRITALMKALPDTVCEATDTDDVYRVMPMVTDSEGVRQTYIPFRTKMSHLGP